MYLNSDFVKSAFLRLRSTSKGGKSHLEKTSALMFFLAFASLSKKEDSRILEFPPKSYARREFENEFRKLVSLERGAQVVELGAVEYGYAKSPEKRLESNFLTSQLKKASEAVSTMDYPKRPKPLLRLGKVDSGMNWGVTAHPDWRENFPIFFNNTGSKTPFTDFAIFIFKYEDFVAGKDVWSSIFEKFAEKYPKSITDFFIQKIQAERVFFKYLDEAVFDEVREDLSSAFRENLQRPCSREDALRAWSKDALVQKILRLEARLDKLGAVYEKC